MFLAEDIVTVPSLPVPKQQDEVVITTSSNESAQGTLEIVQRKVAVPNTAKPVTPELYNVLLVMVAVPETTVHKPVPTPGLLPANVAVVTSQARF